MVENMIKHTNVIAPPPMVVLQPTPNIVHNGFI